MANGKVGRPKSLNTGVRRITINDNTIFYRCTRCGKFIELSKDPKGEFFKSPNSAIYTATDSYNLLCKECVTDLFKQYTDLYGEKMAMIIMCHYLDVYFDENMYEAVKNNKGFSFGIYLAKLNLAQSSSKTFIDNLTSLIDGLALENSDDIRDEAEQRHWSESDMKNKKYCITALGYDCFNDSNYTKEQRRFLYNTLSDYLTDDVIDDANKTQAVINIVKSLLQVNIVNEIINCELKKKRPDDSYIAQYTKTKNTLLSSINSLAKENALSASTMGKNSKGSNTLTKIMKEMTENNFEEIKPNFVSAKMSLSYKEIAEANAKALINELNLSSDEYAAMVATQSEMIQEFQSKIEKLEEENRMLKIQSKYEK